MSIARVRLDTPHNYITVVLNKDEMAWVQDVRHRLDVSLSTVLRLGLLALGQHVSTGQPCPIRKKVGKSWDREHPENHRARRERFSILERRKAGERTDDLAREYGIGRMSMTSLLSETAREQSGESLHDAISEHRRLLIERVLADPFARISSRHREIAQALVDSTTLQEAAELVGVSRQRVHQVARYCTRLAGVDDMRRKPKAASA